MKLLITTLLILSAPQFIFASDNDHVFKNELSKHAFDLKSFDGRYKLSEAQYSQTWKEADSGKTQCPGELGENVIIRSNSIKERRGDMYFNDSIGFWTDGDPSSLITSIEYIDQGDSILSYSNGPSSLGEA